MKIMNINEIKRSLKNGKFKRCLINVYDVYEYKVNCQDFLLENGFRWPDDKRLNKREMYKIFYYSLVCRNNDFIMFFSSSASFVTDHYPKHDIKYYYIDYTDLIRDDFQDIISLFDEIKL